MYGGHISMATFSTRASSSGEYWLQNEVRLSSFRSSITSRTRASLNAFTTVMYSCPRVIEVSSTPTLAGSAARPRRFIPRATARERIPATSSQLNRIPFATAAILSVAPSQSMTNASNSAVNRERSSAHGTRTCLTPCSLHLTRGTVAVRIVWY